MKSKSTYFVVLFCSLTIFSWLILTEAHPVNSDDVDSLSESFGFSSNELPQDDTSPRGKESSLARPKRTIGFLRQLFPGLSQIIDRKIQSITRVLFRVVGRLILRGGAGANGGGASGSGGDGGRRISITLPTYPPIDDEEDTNNPTEKEGSSTEDSSPAIDVRFGADQANATSTEASSSSSASSEESSPSTDAPESNTIVRKVRDVSSDTLTADTTPAIEDETSSETSTKRTGLLWRLGEMRRNRRGSQNSGTGSGNFLLDLIRLVAGSGVTPEKDEELNGPRDERDENNVDGNEVTPNGNSADNSEDQYSAGIPGPLTRLFVLANRGVSNLIQDLILRLAQTGERIINFKARLLTAII